jgi:hypothetical protein
MPEDELREEGAEPEEEREPDVVSLNQLTEDEFAENDLEDGILDEEGLEVDEDEDEDEDPLVEEDAE